MSSTINNPAYLKARAPAGNGVSDLAEEFNKGSTNRTDYNNGLVMERRPLKARSKVDSMGPAEGLMETTTQTKSDYMVRFFSAISSSRTLFCINIGKLYFWLETILLNLNIFLNPHEFCLIFMGIIISKF